MIMTTLNIGDRIQSYDFPGVPDCYLIGDITGFHDDYIHCTTVKIVWEGEEKPIKDKNKAFRVSKPGLMMMDERVERIVKLTK